MIKKNVKTGSAIGMYEFYAEKPKVIAPIEVKRWKDEDGREMVLADNGKTYIAEAFDRNFKIKRQPSFYHDRKFKGANPCRKIEAFK